MNQNHKDKEARPEPESPQPLADVTSREQLPVFLREWMRTVEASLTSAGHPVDKHK